MKSQIPGIALLFLSCVLGAAMACSTTLEHGLAAGLTLGSVVWLVCLLPFLLIQWGIRLFLRRMHLQRPVVESSILALPGLAVFIFVVAWPLFSGDEQKAT